MNDFDLPWRMLALNVEYSVGHHLGRLLFGWKFHRLSNHFDFIIIIIFLRWNSLDLTSDNFIIDIFGETIQLPNLTLWSMDWLLISALFLKPSETNALQKTAYDAIFSNDQFKLDLFG